MKELHKKEGKQGYKGGKQTRREKNGREVLELIDGVKGRFHINNNTDKTQHLMLHFWDISGLLRAFYVFPLIITDNFLTSNFGNLLSNTQAVDASLITTSNNLRINDWNRAHRLIIEHNCNFDVYSEKFEGKGFPAKELVDYIKKSKFSIESDQPISKYIPVLLKKMKSVVLQAGIRGSSEHTIYIMATNIRRSKVGILALPVLIKTSPESDRVTFT